MVIGLVIGLVIAVFLLQSYREGFFFFSNNSWTFWWLKFTVKWNSEFSLILIFPCIFDIIIWPLPSTVLQIYSWQLLWNPRQPGTALLYDWEQNAEWATPHSSLLTALTVTWAVATNTMVLSSIHFPLSKGPLIFWDIFKKLN